MDNLNWRWHWYSMHKLQRELPRSLLWKHKLLVIKRELALETRPPPEINTIPWLPLQCLRVFHFQGSQGSKSGLNHQDAVCSPQREHLCGNFYIINMISFTTMLYLFFTMQFKRLTPSNWVFFGSRCAVVRWICTFNLNECRISSLTLDYNK